MRKKSEKTWKLVRTEQKKIREIEREGESDFVRLARGEGEGSSLIRIREKVELEKVT